MGSVPSFRPGIKQSRNVTEEQTNINLTADLSEEIRLGIGSSEDAPAETDELAAVKN